MGVVMFLVGDRVTFAQSDSFNRVAGEVIDVEVHGDGGVYNPIRHLLVIKDDRRGWVHRVWEKDCRKP